MRGWPRCRGMRSLLAATLMLALPAALAGCAGDPPPDTFYELRAGETGWRFEPPLLDGAVVVERFEADGVLNERALLYKPEQGPELRQYGYHHWVGTPATLLREAVIDVYREANVATRVASPTRRLLPDYRVTGRLVRLYHARGGARDHARGGAGAGVIAVEIAVTRARDGASILLERYERRVPVKTERTDTRANVPAAVGALRAGLTAILGDSLADLTEVVAEGPKS